MPRDHAPKPPFVPDPSEPEVVIVGTRRVACDGGPLGHPRVWLEIGDQDFVECGYCDRRFVLATSGAKAGSMTPGVYEDHEGH